MQPIILRLVKTSSRASASCNVRGWVCNVNSALPEKLLGEARRRKGQGSRTEGRHLRSIHPHPPLLGKHLPSLQVVFVSVAAFPDEASLSHRETGRDCTRAATHPEAQHSKGEPRHKQSRLPTLLDAGQPPAKQPLSLRARQIPSSRSNGASLGHSSAHQPCRTLHERAAARVISESLCSKARQHRKPLQRQGWTHYLPANPLEMLNSTFSSPSQDSSGSLDAAGTHKPRQGV